jgi:hypothetical protein
MVVALSGANLIALVSVVSGAVVGLTVGFGVPLMSARLERQRVKQQSVDARLDELRQVLDSAVQHLFEGYGILYLIHEERRKELNGAEWSPKRLRELGEKLTEEAHLCAEHGLRVDIRTAKDSELSKAQRVANQFFLHYEAVFRRYLDRDLLDEEKPPRPPDNEAFEAILRFQEEIRAFVGVVAPPGPALQSSNANNPG